MYYLQSQTVADQVYYLNEDKEYNVGRREHPDIHILVLQDTSISRKHASFIVKDGKVTFKDLGAKYKNFVNDVELEPQKEYPLNVGDLIKFGVFKSIFKLQEIKFNVCSSSLSATDTNTLTELLKFLKGSFSNVWSADCNYLTVKEITLTIKVLSALIYGQPIVSIKYWEDLVKCVKKNHPMPGIKDYVPEWKEAILRKNVNHFDPNRKTLFQDKIFVFYTEAEKRKMEKMVSLASGQSVSWEKQVLTPADLKKSKPEYLIMEPICDTQPDAYFQDILKQLRKNKKRTISTHEIALAIVNCSCEKDCNQNFNRTGALIKESKQKSGPSKMLAPASQSQSHIEAVVKKEAVVPDSMEFEQEIDITSQIFTINSNTQMDASSQNLTGTNIITEEKNKSKELCLLLEKADRVDEGIQSSIKRESQWSDESFSKRRKMSESQISSEGEFSAPCNRNQPSMSKSNPFMTNSSNIKSKSNTKVANPFALKSERKSDEKINPFASIVNAKRKADTDIVAPADKKLSLDCTDQGAASTSSTFKQPNMVSAKISSKVKNHDKENLCSTAINIAPPFKPDIWNITPIDTSSKKGWCSSRLLKKQNDESLEQEDSKENSELSAYINSFKNTIIVAEFQLLINKVSNCTISNDSTSSNGKRNFKKFKKVMPLHVQVNIIPKASMKRFIFDGKDIPAPDSDSSDEDEVDTFKPKPKRIGGKVFDF